MDDRAKEELERQIAREHAEHPHPEIQPGARRAHLMIHLIVEQQLALGEPPEIARALERLLASGRERHEAIHRLGEVVAREAWAMLQSGRPLDRAALAEKLSELS